MKTSAVEKGVEEFMGRVNKVIERLEVKHEKIDAEVYENTQFKQLNQEVKKYFENKKW